MNEEEEEVGGEDESRRADGYRLARRLPTGTVNDERQKVASYEQSLAHVNDLLSSGGNRKFGSLVNLLGSLANEQRSFAGHLIRTPDGKPHMRLDAVPTNVVPMFAPFAQPYVGDWISAFERARSDATSSYYASGQSEDEEGYGQPSSYDIIVPICSPGGNTMLLKRMLAHMDTAKSLTHPRIRIVTYAYGPVASCAFVFHQAGHICLASHCAQLMCHEPAMTTGTKAGTVSTQADAADQLAGELEELKKRIYQKCELNLMQRCIPGTDMNEAVLMRFRQEWFNTHERQILLFFRSCRPTMARRDGLPYFDYERKSIFHYLTEDVAHDAHHKWIEAPWAWQLGIIDLVGVDLHFRSTTDTIIVEDTEFRQGLACGIY